MIAIVLLAILACASAAPHYHPHHHEHFHNDDDFRLGKVMSKSGFNTTIIWKKMNTELMELSTILNDLQERFPTNFSEGIVENQIKISISGLEDKKINITARNGLLIAESVHKVDDEVERTSLARRSLPDSLNVNGSWTYGNDLLKIVFSLESKNAGEPQGTEDLETKKLVRCNEVVETNEEGTDIQDAFVGIVPGCANEENNSINTNEITEEKETVETTTNDYNDYSLMNDYFII
ncbi:unnamed protein product [Euphydryas editha]|uniref:SHSP domain-containing protein n=1 Tax=Euphydryas editha TaxID=104508 RepID=A0AAU9UVV0_EUPED|nr:unnamed protein product [Euphydryas editha]